MNARWVLVTAALGAGMLAGCNRMDEPAKSKADSPMRSEAPSSPPGPGASTPQSSPTAAERKDSAPVQGQVDTREPAQRKDFESEKR